jgi:hypothetical protein
MVLAVGWMAPAVVWMVLAVGRMVLEVGWMVKARLMATINR